MIRKSEEFTNLVVSQAAGCAARGWRIIPLYGVADHGVCECSRGPSCKSPGKHPRVPKWQDNATTDKDIICGWWKRWPKANLGVRLGPQSNLVDVEFDSEQGKQTAERLLTGIATPTYESHRSTHRLFSFPVGYVPEKSVCNAQGLEIRFGTDERGAQSVFPPSRHAKGVDYCWLPGLSPDETEPAAFPDVLVELLTETARPLDTAATFMMEGDLATHPGAREGERNATLCRLLGRHLAEHGLGTEILGLALEWANRCVPSYPEADVQRTVIAILERHAAPVQASRGGISLTCYSDIMPETVSWLWPNRVAMGKLTIIAGVPGLGKTFLSCDLMARTSQGLPFPDGAAAPIGASIIATAEDGAADTIRPRLDAHGADVSKVYNLDFVKAGTKEEFFSLADHIDQLDQELGRRQDVKLLVIDPISAYLGKVDSNNNSDVRRILGPVAKLAERHQVAIIGIAHLSKRDTKAINRVNGSIAFVAAARAVWLVAPDPDDDKRRLFLPIKNNLASATGLAYRIENGRIEWESTAVLVSADEITEFVSDTPRDEARRWITAKLGEGAKPAREILKQAKAEGICERTLKTAKKELRIVSQKLRNDWVWLLPDDSPKGHTTTRF